MEESTDRLGMQDASFLYLENEFSDGLSLSARRLADLPILLCSRARLAAVP